MDQKMLNTTMGSLIATVWLEKFIFNFYEENLSVVREKFIQEKLINLYIETSKQCF